jgi:hypothetical protein
MSIELHHHPDSVAPTVTVDYPPRWDRDIESMRDRRRAGDPRVCGTCSGYGYVSDEREGDAHTLTIYRELCPRMARCRNGLVHRVLWLLLDDVADRDDSSFRVNVDAIAGLLHCRRESVVGAIGWLQDAGIIGPPKHFDEPHDAPR